MLLDSMNTVVEETLPAWLISPQQAGPHAAVTADLRREVCRKFRPLIIFISRTIDSTFAQQKRQFMLLVIAFDVSKEVT